jgi:hypothetical protein
MYKNKYLKYKEKFLNLKNQFGSGRTYEQMPEYIITSEFFKSLPYDEREYYDTNNIIIDKSVLTGIEIQLYKKKSKQAYEKENEVQARRLAQEIEQIMSKSEITQREFDKLTSLQQGLYALSRTYEESDGMPGTGSYTTIRIYKRKEFVDNEREAETRRLNQERERIMRKPELTQSDFNKLTLEQQRLYKVSRTDQILAGLSGTGSYSYISIYKLAEIVDREKQIETRRLAQERERIQNILNKQIISNIEYGSLLLEYQNLYKGIEDGTITEGQRYRNQYNQYKRK